jgi:hypothetical protein
VSDGQFENQRENPLMCLPDAPGKSFLYPSRWGEDKGFDLRSLRSELRVENSRTVEGVDRGR